MENDKNEINYNMYKHINTTREHEKIIGKFKDGLNILNDQNGITFFNVINFLGCYLSALFKTHYSASDCCNTVETLEKIFQIPKNIPIEHVDYIKIENIFRTERNRFYNFKILGENIPIHTFIVINYKNDWFLLQSFSGICYLHVNQDLDIPNRLILFFKSPTTEEFNNLFGANISKKNISTIDIILSHYEIDELPTKRLKNLLEKYV